MASSLPVQLARGSEYGTYFGPGPEEHPYAGCIVGPVTLSFGQEVAIKLREIKVIAHNKLLLLIGADILCGGRAGWSYRSLGVGPSSKGVVPFANGRRTVALLQ